MAAFVFDGTEADLEAARQFIEADGPVIDFIAVVDGQVVVWSAVDLATYGGFSETTNAALGVAVKIDGQVL